MLCAAKLGSPIDEVFEGHPLSRKGLEGDTGQRVVNSRWAGRAEGASIASTPATTTTGGESGATSSSGYTTRRSSALPSPSESSFTLRAWLIFSLVSASDSSLEYKP